MANDISGVGVVITLIADTTYPVGIPLTQFADDADAVDIGQITLADTAMGLNGNLVAWSRPQIIPVTLNVIPGSADDIALQVLADANRVSQGSSSADDNITMTIIYPDASTVTFRNGRITGALFGKAIAGSGRLKSKQYVFAFENKVGA